MSDSWWDPAAAWWAKAARARKHVQDVLAMAAQYEMSEPYEIVAEPTGVANETAYRFRMLKPVPVELQTTAGDTFHNMRSCLDSVAYELAARHVGALTEKQQLAAEFPIRATRAEFDGFFCERKARQTLYGPRERDAMRCVQPFAIAEDAGEYGVEWATTPAEEYKINGLCPTKQALQHRQAQTSNARGLVHGSRSLDQPGADVVAPGAVSGNRV